MCVLVSTVDTSVGGEECTLLDEAQMRAELARKIRLLVEVISTESGERFTYPVIAAALAERGVPMSRARWSYMLNGSRGLVSDVRVLSALADVFGVDRSYLVPGSTGDVPARIDAQLRHVRASRQAQVQQYAMRTLGDVSPRTLEALTEVLDAHLDDVDPP